MPRVPYTEVGIGKVRGGIEVTTFKQSARGTKYRVDSIVVLSEGKSKTEMRAAIKAAVEKLSTASS